MIDHLYISIALFALTLSIGLVVAYSGMKLWRKLVVIALLALGGISTYRSVFYFYGYPTIMQKSFENTIVIGHLVDKPKKVIYLWLKDGSAVPRSYTIPFTDKTAKFLSKMRRKHKGKPFRAKIENKTSHSNSYKRGVVEDTVMSELDSFPPKR